VEDEKTTLWAAIAASDQRQQESVSEEKREGTDLRGDQKNNFESQRTVGVNVRHTKRTQRVFLLNGFTAQLEKWKINTTCRKVGRPSTPRLDAMKGNPWSKERGDRTMYPPTKWERVTQNTMQRGMMTRGQETQTGVSGEQG
jgi:hypothetical protein